VISLAVLFLVSLGLSAFFSASEMAFVSSNKLQLRDMAEKGDRKAQAVVGLQKKTQDFLAAILIGHNVVNITATTLFAYFLKHQFGIHNQWIVLAVVAPILIIFGEMVPKDYARLRAVPYLLNQIFWLQLFMKLCYLPVLVFFSVIRFLWPSLKKHQKEELFVNEEAFRSLIEESARSGVVGAQEQKLIHTILDFERIQVCSVMIPAEQIPMVDIRSKVGDVKNLAREHKSLMMLVYEEIPSIVVGMIYVFDLVRAGESAQGLRDFLRAPVFISGETSIEKAFLTLQQKRQSYAIVTDRMRNVKGIVPIERLLIFERH
jgi:CBS domain containing-hemolysin-like protein